jgi:hypothetical protein
LSVDIELLIFIWEDCWHGHPLIWYNNLIKEIMKKDEQKCSGYCGKVRKNPQVREKQVELGK